MTSQISGEKIYYLINGAGAARSSLGENKVSTMWDDKINSRWIKDFYVKRADS